MDDSTKFKLHVGGLTNVCLVSWYVTLLMRGHAIPTEATVGEHFSGVTTAISVGAFAVVAFKKWLWKWQVLHPWFVDVPIIAGEWEGDVHRKFKESQPSPVHVKVHVRIEQPLMSKVRYIQTMTDQTAEGHTEACEIYKASDGFFYLEGLYQVTKNEDHNETNGTRKIYYGAMRLKLNHAVFPNELSGTYWSDDFTRGRVTLTRKPVK